MSYISANVKVTPEYYNNHANNEQLQTVTQNRNETTVVESQFSYSKSNDFSWSAIDDPSEMNYNTDWVCPGNCFCYLIFFPLCITYSAYMYLNNRALRRSQKLKITDTHVDFEYNNCCCLKVKYLMSLDDIWFIHNTISGFGDIGRSFEPQLELLYSKDGNENFQSYVQIRGLIESSNTPKIIKDTIIHRRHRKIQTKSYMIPQITSNLVTLESLLTNTHTLTVSLTSEKALIETSDPRGYFEAAFIDSLGTCSVDDSIDMMGKSNTTLKIWSPPVGRDISGSRDYPVMELCFEDDKLCSIFKKAVEDSRDSFK
jgi:hypothetical protein